MREQRSVNCPVWVVVAVAIALAVSPALAVPPLLTEKLALRISAAPVEKPDSRQCTYQSFSYSATDLVIIDPPEAPDGKVYVLCGYFPVRGTLTGTYTSCVVQDPSGIEVIPGEPPWSLFPLGPDPDAYSGYWDEWIDTDKGRVGLDSIGAGTWSTGLQTGLSTIVPERSTGTFAGATGILSVAPEWQTYDPTSPELFMGVVRFSGYLCKP